MKKIFDEVSKRCSRLTTRAYSTSFSAGIFCLAKELRDPIHSIYGFVRFADEIVDSFHQYDKKTLLARFSDDTFEAIEEGISLNPILNNFQYTVNHYRIDHTLIRQFIGSMEMDLSRTSYDDHGFTHYVLGSAEAVGLMCLKVFCEGDQASYETLAPYAMRLGAAFQKINFLRDLNADYAELGRCYFPGLELERFDEHSKKKIEKNIDEDLAEGLRGIKQLPTSARLGVYVAYVYYKSLFEKIRNTPSHKVLESRIRIKNPQKATLLAYSFVMHRLNMI